MSSDDTNIAGQEGLEFSLTENPGIYANSITISATDMESILDFILVTHGEKRLMARIIVSHSLLKSMFGVIQNIINEIERQKGATPGKRQLGFIQGST